MEIFIYRKDREYGPYSLDQVREYLTKGNLVADDYCRVDNDPGWVPLRARLSKLLPERILLPASVPGLPKIPAIPFSAETVQSEPIMRLGQPVDMVGLPAYYQEEFRKIFDSKETYQGKWNWAAFCFGGLWALAKGLWLSLVVCLITGIVVGSVSCGVGALPVGLIYGFVYGFRGNYIYYCAYVKARQMAF